MKKLPLAENLSLPLDAVTQKIAVLGMTGSGKSYCMTKLAEMMLDAHAQVVFLDPKGEAWGLRLMADGKTPAYSIPVFGGDHGDIPLKPDMGKRIADLLVDGDYSAVLDVSEFISSELALFGYEFATRLFERKKQKPGAMSLMIDEVQDFIPQNPSTGSGSYEPKMLAAFERVGKQLRSKGVGMVLAGQRPQEINKKVLNMCELWLAFQMTGLQERDTMEKLIKDADREEASRLKELLPTLETGNAHIWSPRWLKVSDTFHILEKKTFDSSATPEVGARRVEPRKLSPVDVEAITADWQDVIEEAEKKDPEILLERLERGARQLHEQEREIERLKSELQRAQSKVVTKPVEVPAIKPAEIKRLEMAIEHLEKAVGRGLKRAQQVIEQGIERAQAEAAAILEKLGTARQRVEEDARNLGDTLRRATAQPQTANPQPPSPKPSPGRRAPPPRRVAAPTGNNDERISRAQQQIINAIAFYEVLGNSEPTRTAVAGFCAMPMNSTWRNNLSALRVKGLIEDRAGDGLALTLAGQARAEYEAEPPTLNELHRLWLNSFSASQAEILELLIRRYPHSVTREDICEVLGMENNSTLRNNLSALRVRGALVDREGNSVAASKLLFPEGLR